MAILGWAAWYLPRDLSPTVNYELSNPDDSAKEDSGTGDVIPQSNR
jgi:hypothetical protein